MIGSNPRFAPFPRFFFPLPGLTNVYSYAHTVRLYLYFLSYFMDQLSFSPPSRNDPSFGLELFPKIPHPLTVSEVLPPRNFVSPFIVVVPHFGGFLLHPLALFKEFKFTITKGLCLCFCVFRFSLLFSGSIRSLPHSPSQFPSMRTTVQGFS